MVKEIASVCGITEDGVAYHIKKLKQSGVFFASEAHVMEVNGGLLK